jgi:hypothetical protein
MTIQGGARLLPCHPRKQQRTHQRGFQQRRGGAAQHIRTEIAFGIAQLPATVFEARVFPGLHPVSLLHSFFRVQTGRHWRRVGFLGPGAHRTEQVIEHAQHLDGVMHLIAFAVVLQRQAEVQRIQQADQDVGQQDHG